MPRCATCGLPIELVTHGDGSRHWAHEGSTLGEVVARALTLGVPVTHNLTRHAGPRRRAIKERKSESGEERRNLRQA